MIKKSNVLTRFQKLLSGGDLRSLGNSNLIISEIRGQNDFDELFKCLFHESRVVVMRAADAIEKITVQNPSYLTRHKKALLELCNLAKNKELKWHLALLVTRLNLSGKETKIVWQVLSGWILGKKESKIVRVNSMQALSEIVQKEKRFAESFRLLLTKVEQENIPSLNARIRRICTHNFNLK